MAGGTRYPDIEVLEMAGLCKERVDALEQTLWETGIVDAATIVQLIHEWRLWHAYRTGGWLTGIPEGTHPSIRYFATPKPSDTISEVE